MLSSVASAFFSSSATAATALAGAAACFALAFLAAGFLVSSLGAVVAAVAAFLPLAGSFFAGAGVVASDYFLGAAGSAVTSA